MTGRCTGPRRRGLTLLELMLALTITALVAAAIASMLGVVTSGVISHRDNRSVMIRANAAQTRLAAYIAPSLCFLGADDSDLVLWRGDTRQSGTVHATEIRWLIYDETAGAIDVHYVSFPDAWTQTAIDLADEEFPPDANWELVRNDYQAAGHLATRRLVDGVGWVQHLTDAVKPHDSRHVTCELDLAVEGGVEPVRVTAAIRRHAIPENPS